MLTKSPRSSYDDSNPEVLASHVTSLFQAAFAEIGIFIAVFLAITHDRAFTWGWTYIGVALFMAQLGLSAFELMKLHSLERREPQEIVKRYRRAWRRFSGANVTILAYFILWWFHMLFPNFLPWKWG